MCVALKKKDLAAELTLQILHFFHREGDEINLCVSNCWIQKNDQQKKKSSKLSDEQTIPEFEALENWEFKGCYMVSEKKLLFNLQIEFIIQSLKKLFGKIRGCTNFQLNFVLCDLQNNVYFH